MSVRLSRLLLAACFFVVASAASAAPGRDTAPAADLVIDARVLPSPQDAVIEQGRVLVRDGRIVAVGPRDTLAVPAGATVVDAPGATLVAGFWNSHVHFLDPVARQAGQRPAAELQATLDGMLNRWGFTTVFDIAAINGAGAALRRRIESGDIAGPAVLTVDAPFFPANGTPYYVREVLEQAGAPSAEVADVAQARERARRQLAEGADGVKLFAGAIVGGDVGVLPMDVDIARAIVDEAHRGGKPAFAHPTDMAGLEVALASGVDVLAHTTPTTGPWSDALVARLRVADMALVPTLSLFDDAMVKDAPPAEVVERFMGAAVQQVRAMHAAGGQILFGTDVDFAPVQDTGREFALLASAGLDWRAILASLTTAPSTRFGQAARRGRIAPGLQADLVLLGGDPRQDVAAFAHVRQVWRDGRVVYPRQD